MLVAFSARLAGKLVTMLAGLEIVEGDKKLAGEGPLKGLVAGTDLSGGVIGS